MKDFTDFVDRRISHAKQHVERLEAYHGDNPTEKFTYWGGWDMGYWKGNRNAYETIQDNLSDLQAKIDKYRAEIVKLRGRAHLSCPACHDDCVGWVTDGEPCRKDWEL